MLSKNLYSEPDICRVCGLLQEDKSWGEDGKTPTFDICACCGTEFGYDDANKEAVKRTRQRWLDGGAVWFAPEFRPERWNLSEQLKQVPGDFR